VQNKSLLFLLVLIFPLTHLIAQSTATLEGKLTDENGKEIDAVSVSIEGSSKGTITNPNGTFSLEVPAMETITISFTHISYQAKQLQLFLQAGEKRQLLISLKESDFKLEEVEVEVEQNRDKPMESIDPKNLKYVPNPSGNFEAVIKTLPGVYSNNELTSQYNVRGGNFDENLVYVNDIEVYRPFLTRSGNQEGLSFINADMVDNIDFSAGGFEARYGDKMSSVLAVTYRRPKEFGGTVSGSLQGGSLHVEGRSKDARLTFINGVRYHTNRYVLGSLDTDGDYRPTFVDAQTFVTYNLSEKWELSFLGNYARNKYEFVPETRETSFGTIQQALKLTIFFEGQEVTDFETYFGAFSANFKPKGNVNLNFTLTGFRSFETETFDILGQYRIDELERDLSSDNFGDVAFSRGVGSFLNHARNFLDATVLNFQHRGRWLVDNGSWEWGGRIQHESIEDRLSEWNLIDSAGFSLPQTPQKPGQAPNRPIELNLFDSFKARNNLVSNRVMGYAQRNLRWKNNREDQFSLTGGIRANYWDLNQETVISPRANIAWEPKWKKDWLFRFSTGYYYQPPFYRELRDFEGELNKDIKAQRSIHFVFAGDYNFLAWGRPFKFVGEAYYKKMDNIIPYEIDNVRIRYFAENIADAFAVGVDFKINGEFVKGVDSWVNFGLLTVQEDLQNDFYVDYFNSDGEKIIPGFTFNDTPIDSIRREPGYIPRPSDQRFNFSLFFQDYLPKNPTYKMSMTFHYGSGLPFGPPSRERYKDTLRIPAYLRVDMGFSKLLLGPDSKVGPKNIFKDFQSIWLGLEIFNLLQRNNTLSHLWVTDVTNRQFAVPNFLTSRQVNIRLQFKF
tara:strand:+ start:4157 stop:6688 length:2532 start_codon:yes stop_codon:yes gene_type:complete